MTAADARSCRRRHAYARARAAAGRDTRRPRPTRCCSAPQRARRQPSAVARARTGGLLPVRGDRAGPRRQAAASRCRRSTSGPAAARAGDQARRRCGWRPTASGFRRRRETRRRTAEQQLAAQRRAASARYACRRTWSVTRSFSPARLPGLEPAVLEAPILAPASKARRSIFDDTNRGFLAQDVGYFERTQPFSLDLWVLAAQVYEDSMVSSIIARTTTPATPATSCNSRRISFGSISCTRGRQHDSRADQTADCRSSSGRTSR